jgi:hypothetical protein
MKQAEVDSTSKRVSAICALMHRAYRDLRFYPQEHPVPKETVHLLAELLARFLTEEGSLVLGVEEDQLVFGEEVVYAHAESRDNLAFIMFRDGLRAVSFHSGLDADEIEAFVRCLAHADDLLSNEQDLLTVFWEQDFVHVDYEAADPFFQGGVLREETIDTLRETVLRRLEETDLSLVDLKADAALQLTLVPHLGTRPQDFVLTSQELQDSELRVDGMASALDDFALVLLELLANRDKGTESDNAFSAAMTAVVGSYLGAADLEGLCLFLERVQCLESSRECAEGTAGQLLTHTVSSDGLADLIRAGDRGAADHTRVQELIDLVGSCDCSVLLDLLADSEERNLRKSLLSFLQTGEHVPGRELLPLLGDPRWFVARNALQLARVSHDRLLIPSVERLTAHEDPRVRREAVRTLDALAGAEALPTLTRSLADSDSAVRTAAARSSLRQGGSGQETALVEQMKNRDFANRPGEEVEAMFLALISLAKERAVPTISKLSRRRFLHPTPVAVRLAAVSALGTLPSPAARRFLDEAARSGEESVRLAAKKALVRQGP